MPTLYSKIEQYLRSGIHDGTWKPGDVLPKEIEMCEMFNVSRPTVRTALANLVQEGLITRTKRKGTCVKAWRTLESSTVFIESFQQELAEKGVETVTEVLEFPGACFKNARPAARRECREGCAHALCQGFL